MTKQEEFMITKLRMYVGIATISPLFNRSLIFYKKEVKFLTDYIENNEEVSKEIIGLAVDILRLAYKYYTSQDTSKLYMLYLTDAQYDDLMAAVYRKTGFEISKGYIPDDVKKVKPSDPDLVNVSMDRCYLLDDNHKLPIKIPNKNTAEEILAKMYDKSGLKKTDKVSVMVTPKIDGVGFATSVNGGVFTNPTQKGITMDGDDNTSMSVRGLIGYSLGEKPLYEDCNVQYEAFIDEKNMKRIKEELGLVYKFPRAAASGIMNRLVNYEDTLNGKVERDVFFDNLYFYPIAVSPYDIYEDGVEKLIKLGHVPKELNKSIKTFKGDFEQVLEFILDVYKYWLNENPKLSFDLDGVVVTVTSKKVRKAMGRKNDCNKYQFAFKFPPKMAYVKIKEIKQSSGNLGRRTPMVTYDPTIIDGSSYTDVPFSSVTDFKDFKLAVGDEAILYIGGDCVPKLTWDDTCKRGKNKFEKMNTCHACGHEFDYDGKLWICENSKCPDNILGSIVNFFDKLDVDYDAGAARVVVDALDSKGWSFSISNIPKLEPEDVIELGKNMSRKFISDIRKKLSSVDESVIFATQGIPTFGRRKSKLLLENISLNDIIRLYKEDNIQLLHRISSIKGIGNNGAEALISKLGDYVDDLVELMKFNPKPCIVAEVKELTDKGREVAKALGVDFEDEVIYIKTSVSIDEQWQDALDELGFKQTTSKFKANKAGTNRPKFNLVLTMEGQSSSTIDVAKDFNIPIVFRDAFMEKFKG